MTRIVESFFAYLLGLTFFGYLSIEPNLANALDIQEVYAMHEQKRETLTDEQRDSIKYVESQPDAEDNNIQACVLAINEAKQEGYKPLPEKPFGDVRVSFVNIHKDFNSKELYDQEIVVVCCKAPSMLVIGKDKIYVVIVPEEDEAAEAGTSGAGETSGTNPFGDDVYRPVLDFYQ